jgi:hypothetical protein
MTVLHNKNYYRIVFIAIKSNNRADCITSTGMGTRWNDLCGSDLHNQILLGILASWHPARRGILILRGD